MKVFELSSMGIAPRVACLALMAMAASAPAAERLVWFGTYTTRSANSEGIYVSKFDDSSGAITPPVLATQLKNPEFFAIHPVLPVIYAAGEVLEDGKYTRGMLSLTIDERTGKLTKQSWQPSGWACHVSVDRAGKVVLTAHYAAGSVVCHGLDADGSLRPVAKGSPGGFVQHEGKSVNPQRQESPHAHSIYPSFDGRFAIACDLGIDKVLVHSLDVDKATLAPHAFASVKPGAGPRHFAFHPGGRFGYVCNELDLTVTGFAFDAPAGTLTEFQTLSTLPADVTDRKGLSTAEIVAHPNGKFLYVSNRGHHSIAMFSIDEPTGKLTFLGAEPIRGRTPRNFVVDPSGKFLLAGGMDSNTVTVFAIDQATGRLTFTGRSIDVPTPACIRFRP